MMGAFDFAGSKRKKPVDVLGGQSVFFAVFVTLTIDAPNVRGMLDKSMGKSKLIWQCVLP